MKKKIFFLIFLILAGSLSYFGGYYLYISENPKEVYREPDLLRSGITTENVRYSERMPQEYYFAQIEQKTLMIYQMPEGILYDSVELSSMHLPETEKIKLTEGVRFENLQSVFEYLENSMS